MVSMIISEKWPSSIYKLLNRQAELVIISREDRANLDIVMDIHWIFLHSLYHKQNTNYKRHTGKWKYDADSQEDLIEKAKQVMPLVADRTFPVVKFTNLGNVFSGEMLLVVYCFPFGPQPAEAKRLLIEQGLNTIYWGSEKFKEV